MQKLETVLDEAETALLRSAAQDVLVEQIIAELGAPRGHHGRSGSAIGALATKKRKAAA